MEKDVIYCRSCDALQKYEILPAPPPHAGKIVCAVCDSWISWIAKDRNKEKRPKNTILPDDLGIDYCQMCLRPRGRLGIFETLDSHHIIEVDGLDKGKDVKENILVLCSHCHVLTHHIREYLHYHLLNFVNPDADK